MDLIDDEHISVVQRHNRAVRMVNRNLRRILSRLQNETDYKVAVLMDTSSQAEEALEKIRVLGGIDCSPDDYDTIIAVCVATLNQAPTSQ